MTDSKKRTVMSVVEENREHVVLVAGLGTSPAVITETVWEMGVNGELPDEVIVLTTSTGWNRLERELLHPFEGRTQSIWQLLLSQLERKRIEVATLRGNGISPAIFRNGDGDLDDLRTGDDNLRAADMMLRTIAGVQRENTRVVASIAGGRKTMSALLFSCMSLVGRPQDKIYHVLVDPKYETRMTPNYYFQGQGEKHRDPQAKTAVPSSRIKAELFDVPYARMHDWYCDKYGEEIPTYKDLIQNIHRAAPKRFPKIVIDVANGVVEFRYGDAEVKPVNLTKDNTYGPGYFAYFLLWISEHTDKKSLNGKFTQLQNLKDKMGEVEPAPKWVRKFWKGCEQVGEANKGSYSGKPYNTLKHDLRKSLKTGYSEIECLLPVNNGDERSFPMENIVYRGGETMESAIRKVFRIPDQNK